MLFLSGGDYAAEIFSVFGHPVDVTGGISTKDLSSNPFVVFVGR